MDQMSASSIISLRTVSDGTGLETDRRQGRRSSTGTKRPKKPASPYGTIKSLPKKQTKRTGREIWVESIQNGGGVSAEGKVNNTWRYGKPPNLANATSATSFLKGQLLAGSGSPLPNRISRPSSANARVGGTGPVYKDAESYYDEIQALKRQLKQLKYENDEAKAKNVRMEDEIIAKSRKIEELLNPEMQSNDMRRTLTSKKPGSSEVVMSLRRKVYKLEENLRDKETTVKKMKRDIKQTDVEELILENQMYLYEIGRLMQNIKDLQNTHNTISDDVINEALKDTEGKKSQLLIKRLTEDNQGLVLENKSLKNDLMKLSKGGQSDINLDKDYEDMNRSELLQKISSLEQSLKVEEKKVNEVDISEITVDLESIDDRCIELKGPLPQQIKQLRARERELLAQVESLENTVKKLKEDRSHYRKKNDEYRQQLDNVKKKTDDVGSDTASIRSEKSPKHRKSPVSGKKNSDRVSKIKEDKITEAKVEELQKTNAAKKIQRGWRKRQTAVLEKDKSKKPSEEEDLENAIISIQASWRGHKARESYINSARDEYSSELSNREEDIDLEDDDVLLIQSALRGHSSRKRLLQKSKKPSYISSKSVVSSVVDEQYFHSEEVAEETDDDDDVVIGSSASLLHYRANDIRSQKVSRTPTNNYKFHMPTHSSRSNHVDGSRYSDTMEKSHVDGSRYSDTMEKSHVDGSRYSDTMEKSHVDGSRYSDTIEKSGRKFSKHQVEENEMQNSLKSLKSSSSPWPESIHDDIDSEENEHQGTSSRTKNTSKKSSKKSVKSRDDHEESDIANKWANSGNKDSEEQGSFQKRLSLRKSQQLLKDFEADDEDDLVVGAAFQKKLGSLGNKKSLLDDELF